MKPLHFSFIIPVFNRPHEIHELLESFTKLKGDFDYSICIIEDGSTVPSDKVIEQFDQQLKISYHVKENSGPGDSRNYGMARAKGDYFIILDSDVLLPEDYLQVVTKRLSDNYTDCYGGPDAAHASFSKLQKAINFVMTSFITTGGIRGGKDSENFQPRSFNMGLSKEAFQASGGFGTIHPGEDPDLSLRLASMGYKSQLIKEAYVYHKRRISWSKFYQQVYKFGLVRPILNRWHPKSERLIFWLPTLFSMGFVVSILMLAFNVMWLLYIYLIYMTVAFIMALLSSKNVVIGVLSVIAIFVQFFGYGYGFFKSTLAIKFLKVNPEKRFPKLFFKHVQ
ncbi:cellulose synthase/poly-beta-1,6-N-acetylglucosamine synthase-like glycosyltransferase [Gelidibacter algens]|uniref:Cellulose synthase/poly-beta-1,6-N-acetylglucosamine synthase-like glycosyltransferase n=1 Tax=Gelidibacter algens TaxID=49280 RepID=A0A1A7R691_9FLAO|nr:glycosyltransferase [Gelidibacter algens]OBX26267.1 glycosyl transferase family 2 [Gelidibacter algens]RAJ24852.1 cellulose synthase/poly-beta-1,6-N-acetylglucosamine synthase-like glycosyltransferase [Gelidibacter algens]